MSPLSEKRSKPTGPRCSDGSLGCATLITRNLPFDEWTETFGSERLTGALLDRLTHQVHIIEVNGDSYRLGQSRARKLETST